MTKIVPEIHKTLYDEGVRKRDNRLFFWPPTSQRQAWTRLQADIQIPTQLGSDLL
ncbi:uncharacterized protein MELLADRAFT_55667 [Melampsora larici-populina 98AG31]|uniref:Uncharacterized protein n=1 Tax=Melampsora larici-populina (strain 98AG31 / pathotype 3-4-7) TaxID=747676 RepID=F4RGW2_MELLP|nr:uncharacterized protein MELLADRAFT_55667 [Melampsora larici-populina 98AG31]EGG08327.1 hypothetical protein MELLADRAFT_55667 [Melampsora larici-populina 98AG31]